MKHKAHKSESSWITFEKKLNNCTFPTLNRRKGFLVLTEIKLRLFPRRTYIFWGVLIFFLHSLVFGSYHSDLERTASDPLPRKQAEYSGDKQRNKRMDRPSATLAAEVHLKSDRHQHADVYFMPVFQRSGAEQETGRGTELNRDRNLWPVLLLSSLVIVFLLWLLWYREQRQKRLEIHLATLRSAQINPHFLSNSLNAIENLIHQGKNREAARYVIYFSRFSHQVLQRSRRPNISLREELRLLEYFLKLEKLRFPDKLTYEIKLDKALHADLIEVPALFLQGYVEDAIWDGIKPKEGASRLQIELKKEDNYLLAIVEDNGIGRKASRALKARSLQEQRSLGMEISEERILTKIKLKRARIETIDLHKTSGEAAGTCVHIRLPITGPGGRRANVKP